MDLAEARHAALTKRRQDRVGGKRDGWPGLRPRIRQVEQIDCGFVERSCPRVRICRVPRELGVAVIKEAASDRDDREARVGIAAVLGEAVGVQLFDQPFRDAVVLRGGVLLELQPAEDPAVCGRQVVGVDGLVPVKCGPELSRLLQLPRQSDRYEPEDFAVSLYVGRAFAVPVLPRHELLGRPFIGEREATGKLRFELDLGADRAEVVGRERPGVFSAE